MASRHCNRWKQLFKTSVLFYGASLPARLQRRCARPESSHPPRYARSPNRSIGRNVVPKRFGHFISTSFKATYVLAVLKTGLGNNKRFARSTGRTLQGDTCRIGPKRSDIVEEMKPLRGLCRCFCGTY